MKRISKFPVFLTLALLTLSPGREGKAETTCRGLVEGFNTSEDYDDNMKRLDRLDFFPIRDVTPHSGFEGIAVPKRTKASLLVMEVSWKGGGTDKHEFNLEPFTGQAEAINGEARNRLRVSGFKTEAVFHKDEVGSFNITLKRGSATLCKDSGLPIEVGD
jgi:hypothetical protein